MIAAGTTTGAAAMPIEMPAPAAGPTTGKDVARAPTVAIADVAPVAPTAAVAHPSVPIAAPPARAQPSAPNFSTPICFSFP